MLNRKYYPFERNSYYFGKLLTAKDFEAEQKYFNDKRRFMNRLTGANGIVAGLGVIMADDASIIVQAGCAWDASGREMVVPETKVIKLSTIDGFSQLTTSSAFLGISYAEQPADEVYSVMSEDDANVKYNKVREQYKLTLLDENLVASIPSPLDEFVSRTVIYSDHDVELIQHTPKFVPRGCDVSVWTEIRRLEPGAGEYSFIYQLETPGFRNEDGQASSEISMNNVKLACGEAKTMCTRLNPEEYLWGGGSPAVTVTGLTVKKNDEAFQLKQNLEIQLKPVDDTLSGHYLASYYQKSMDKVLSESYDERLWIARIRLIRQNSSVIIDRIDPPPFGQYVYNAQQLMQLAQLEAYYPEIALRAAAVSGDAAAASRHVAVEQTSAVHNTACGVFDFPLGLGYDMRQPMYSDEIMHGLGKGPVYVEVGLEYITADDTREGDSEIILGDADIFSGSNTTQEERVYQVSTAVKVLPERGTFIVGMKLNEPTGLLSLRVRWYAFRLDEVNKQIGARREGEKMILINPDTIVLQPKSTAHISPVFINMPTEACNFRVVDPEGGSVDNNGLYTAPSKEGVYEIRVEAVSDPTVYTHVFAIVTQKKKD